MISNSKIIDTGIQSLKGFRLKAAGMTFFGPIALAILLGVSNIICGTADIVENPTLKNYLIDCLISFVLQSSLIYLFTIGFYAYFHDIYKHRTSSAAMIFAGFKKFIRNIAVLGIVTLITGIYFAITCGIMFFYLSRYTLENNFVSFCILVLVMGALCSYLTYKFLPTWIGLVIKLPTDDTTGPIELIKQTYSQVSDYNFKFLCLTLRLALWNLLGVITIGIGFLWTIPLCTISAVIFFDTIFNPEEGTPPKIPENPQTPEADSVL